MKRQACLFIKVTDPGQNLFTEVQSSVSFCVIVKVPSSAFY